MGLRGRCEMTWDIHRGRWRKVYKGKVYYFAPRSGDKASTYQAANAWWRAKRAELDHTPLHPLAGEAISMRQKMLDYLTLEDNLEDRQMKSRLEQEISSMRSGAEINKPHGASFDPTASMAMSDKIGWIDRIATVEKYNEWTGKTPVIEDRTIGSLADKYLAVERVRCDSGEIKIGTWDQERGCLFAFRDWIGASQDAAIISADKYESYWERLSKSHHSIDSRKRHLRIAKQFIVWLSEKGAISLPTNLGSRRYRFKGESKPIATMSVEQVRNLVENATGQLKLHLFLMLNCGFTQVDITDLRQSEVDWTQGRITRRRSKATSGGYSKAPLVTWQLWNQNFSLLKQYRQPIGERVLLTEDGTPWTTRQAKGEDRFAKKDSIISSFRRLLDKLAKSHPGDQFGSLSELRATASTMLDNHETYGRYAQHFLGHSPRSVAQSNYVSPSQTQFDKAVIWLGEQFGF